MSVQGMSAKSLVELSQVVVRFAPFQFTTAPRTKSDPLTVRTKLGPFDDTVDGVVDNATGNGFCAADGKNRGEREMLRSYVFEEFPVGSAIPSGPQCKRRFGGLSAGTLEYPANRFRRNCRPQRSPWLPNPYSAARAPGWWPNRIPKSSFVDPPNKDAVCELCEYKRASKRT
jgi:hypothetical protein